MFMTVEDGLSILSPNHTEALELFIIHPTSLLEEEKNALSAVTTCSEKAASRFSLVFPHFDCSFFALQRTICNDSWAKN